MKLEFSAGGIIFRKGQNELFILVCQHSSHHGWVFPKGRIGDHVEYESKEETATREVKEETGVTAAILKPIEPITYYYEDNGQKIKKTVYYFLMEYVEGDITKHDWEMENVEWIKKEKVEKKLTYLSDKKAWQDAQKYI